MAGAHSHDVLHSLSKQILSFDNQTNSRQTVGEEPSMAQACSHIVLRSSSFKHDLYFNKTKVDRLPVVEAWTPGPQLALEYPRSLVSSLLSDLSMLGSHQPENKATSCAKTCYR